MKKILGLGIVALMVMAMVGGGTWAYFSDTETSTGNILTAGTLDLKTNDADGVSATLLATNMAPGDSVPTGSNATVTLKNAGSINATSLDITVSYVEADGASEPTDPDLLVVLTADQFAAGLTVNTLDYGGTDLLALLVSDTNTNGRIDMQDVQAATLTGLSGIDANNTKDFKIQVTLYANANNDFQNDGIDVTFTFTLQQ